MKYIVLFKILAELSIRKRAGRERYAVASDARVSNDFNVEAVGVLTSTHESNYEEFHKLDELD